MELNLIKKKKKGNLYMSLYGLDYKPCNTNTISQRIYNIHSYMVFLKIN
jgi:hypothetical protein